MKENLLFKLSINTSRSHQLIFANSKNEFLQPSKTREWILPIQKKYNQKKVTTNGQRIAVNPFRVLNRNSTGAEKEIR